MRFGNVEAYDANLSGLLILADFLSEGCHPDAGSGSHAFIACMSSRMRSQRGRPLNAPAAFIHPCQPIVAKQPPIGPSWAHELKHDGYRLQIHVRKNSVRLYTMNGADWIKRYPRIVEEAARLREPLIIDAEVVHLSAEGVADFDALHSGTADDKAVPLPSIFCFR